MENDIAISVKNVSKTFKIPHEKVTSLRSAAVGVFSRKRGYEEFKALDDVSFEVKKGEFFGIIGRNGSGKSTLLKILAGIYQPDKGKIKINGMISPFLELGIGFNPELSGRDNIYLNATVLGMTKKQIDKKFDDIVKFSELERFIDQKLKNYSSGMQVRLAFSVSIHANRDILLMDEVLAVGDSNFQSKCLTEFSRYKGMGRTVVIVTHDISVVQRYCDRAMLLRNGRVMEIGKAVEVADKYVFDNMDDEERRVVEDEKRMNLYKNNVASVGTTSVFESNRSVEIIKVELLGGNKNEKRVFCTGENFEIKVTFKRYSNIDELNIGISLQTEDDIYILGYNTQMDGIVIGKKESDVTLSFKSLDLLKGSYKINVASFGSNNNDRFDFKPDIKRFKVFSVGEIANYKGFVNLKHEWK